ncbi:alpha/beta hydrolase [Paenibacillus sp. HB172176]|uniref:alpha/beta fold hydrolase n=1 Tax=Paenibacillus sp. HB172176 TaxID=2493690 RepID=UPI00143B325D|nr:alpha/beta hydrolase [Paenibacillus sp. HB172176]
MNDQQRSISIANASISLGSGSKLAYYDSGPGDASVAPLVLLHGYCGSSAYWEMVVAELATNRRIIAPDARGHGSSDAPSDEIYTMERFSDDLNELLGRLNIDQAIIMGHSLGGYIALAYAERHSGALAGFGLVHSTPLPDSDEAKANRDKAVQALEERGIAPFVEGLLPKLFAQDGIDLHQEQLFRGKEIGYGTSLHGAIATAKGMKERESRVHVVEGLSVPVLLAAGTKDGVIPVSSTFAASNGRTTKAELPSGHMSMMECPDRLVRAILSFVREEEE